MTSAVIGFVLGAAMGPLLLMLSRAAVDYYRQTRGQTLNVGSKERRQMWIRDGV